MAPLKTTFELNDTLYAEAEVEDNDTVYLWLGVRIHDFHPFKLDLKSSAGKCHAFVQTDCRYYFTTIEIGNRSDKPE